MSILLFIADSLFFVLVVSAFLRVWLNWLGIRFVHQPGPFIVAVTDWLVMPIRRWLPAYLRRVRVDLASVFACVILAGAHAGILLTLNGGGQGAVPQAMGMAWLPMWVLVTFKLLFKAVLQGAWMIAFLYVVLSWVQPASPVQHWLSQVLAPVLNPLRRVIPLVGGVDLSVLALILLLQIGLMSVG